MCDVEVKDGKKYSIKVIRATTQKEYISARDAEMDARAVEAVRSAIKSAQIRKKPIARYDVLLKKAYIEFADGERRYINEIR